MGALRSPDRPVMLLVAALAAGASPAFDGAKGNTAGAAAGFPGWPAAYEGRALTPLPLTAREEGFVRDFPGRIGRFTDGTREIILRWVAEPTRRLHPASDCFKGGGYRVTPLPMRKDHDGRLMGCFRAEREIRAEHAKSSKDTMTVCEAIRDEQGATWSDASSWYWSALFGSSDGPWWSVVVGER